MSSLDTKVEENISEFFSRTGASASRDQCDNFANETFGGPIKPIPLQGVYSYTVTAAGETLVVQFRDPNSPLDVDTLTTAQNAHPDFVAGCSFHGTIGSPPAALLVYSMNKLPGVNYLDIAISMPEDNFDLQLATVRSLARFFAQSWQNKCLPDGEILSAIFEDCCSNFDYLADNLPARFRETVTHVRENLPKLFSKEYPLVITHGDLSELNILANPKTGEITGIVDWAEADIQPFGFALYALDNILGYMTPNGWVFWDNAEHLRDEFWKFFSASVGGVSQSDMEFIRLARLAGLLLRYGIPHRPGRKGVVGVGGSKNSSIRFLDALILVQNPSP